MTNHITMQKLFTKITQLEKTMIEKNKNRIKEIEWWVKKGTDKDLAKELEGKHSRFSDSMEVRFMKETIRANKIQKELEYAEQWYMSEVQYRENRDNQLNNLKNNKEVEKIADMINEIKDIKFVKRKRPKTINILFIFLMMMITFILFYGVDY